MARSSQTTGVRSEDDLKAGIDEFDGMGTDRTTDESGDSPTAEFD